MVAGGRGLGDRERTILDFVAPRHRDRATGARDLEKGIAAAPDVRTCDA
jgi:hypothetical protein